MLVVLSLGSTLLNVLREIAKNINIDQNRIKKTTTVVTGTNT